MYPVKIYFFDDEAQWSLYEEKQFNTFTDAETYAYRRVNNGHKVKIVEKNNEKITFLFDKNKAEVPYRKAIIEADFKNHSGAYIHILKVLESHGYSWVDVRMVTLQLTKTILEQSVWLSELDKLPERSLSDLRLILSLDNADLFNYKDTYGYTRWQILPHINIGDDTTICNSLEEFIGENT
jgi:hypothetical protein